MLLNFFSILLCFKECRYMIMFWCLFFIMIICLIFCLFYVKDEMVVLLGNFVFVFVVGIAVVVVG